MVTQSCPFTRHQQQQYKAGPCRPHMKAPGGESEGQTGAQRPLNHQGTSSQGFQGPHSHTNQGLHQEQNQELHNTRVHTGPDPKHPSLQERSDPHTLVQYWGDRSR